MKNLLLMFLLASSMTYAADWSPMFAHLETGKTGSEAILALQIIKSNVGSNSRDMLTDDAKKGVYKSIPQPYRADMLPAKAIKGKEVALEVVIPLKNATLYGQPLESLTKYYGCFNCGDVGFYATFKPMTNQQYQALMKKVSFKKVNDSKGVEGYACGMDEGEPIAGFHKDGGKVHLVVYMGC